MLAHIAAIDQSICQMRVRQCGVYFRNGIQWQVLKGNPLLAEKNLRPVEKASVSHLSHSKEILCKTIFLKSIHFKLGKYSISCLISFTLLRELRMFHVRALIIFAFYYTPTNAPLHIKC
jgi:hypothetical protein